MGHVYARATFTNMDDASKRVEVNALVDTGATFSVLPAGVAAELGLEPTDRTRVDTAAGALEMDLAWAFVEVNGRRAPTPVIINDRSEHILLGVVTLEILRLGVDPSRGELKEVNALLF